MLTPIVIDDVHPADPRRVPRQGGGRASACSVSAVAGGRRARPLGGPRALAADRRATTWQSRRRCDDGGNDRWDGLDHADRDRRRTSSSIDAWTDRYATWRHEIEVKAAAGPGRRARAGGGGPLLEDLAAKRPAPADRERLQAAGDGDPPHELHAGGPARRRRPTTRWRRSWRACPTPGCRRRPAPAVGRPPARRPRRLVRAVPPVSFGGLRGAAEHLPVRRRPGLRRRLPAADPPDRRHRTARAATTRLDAGARRPRQPVGHRLGRGRPRRHRTPSSARSTTSTPSSPRPPSSASRWRSTTRSSARPDHPWVHEHPEWFHQRPDGSIRYAENPPKKYQDIYPINFWPGRGRRPRGAVGGVPRRPRALDRPRRPHLPRRQPAHQAAGVLGVGHRATSSAATPTCVFLAEAFTRPEGDGQAGRGRLHARATRTSPGAHEPWELREYVDGARPRPRWPTTCGRTSGPTRPTSSTSPLRHGPPAAFAMRLRAGRHPRADLRHLPRLRAVRERAGQRHQRRSTCHSEKYEIKARDCDAAARRWRRSSAP